MSSSLCRLFTWHGCLQEYVTAEYAKEKGLTIKNLSGTKFRQMLRAGDEIPNWFAFESVVKVLREEAQAAGN